MVRDIVVDGDPILRRSVNFVEIDNPELVGVIRDLWDTCNYIGAAGLAANQIGRPFKVCVIKPGSLTLINPSIVHGKDRFPSVEGCFSIPGYKAVVPRWGKIKVVSRRPLESESRLGLFTDLKQAVIIQHEVDHLNGILIKDYVEYEHSKKDGVLIHQYDADYETALYYKKQLEKTAKS